MASRRVRVVTANDTDVKGSTQRKVVSVEVNPKVSNLTPNEKRARRYATTSSMGGLSFRSAGDIVDSGAANFYSPQLSTDFLEKPQNLRERRAFYRFFYNTNEIIGQAIDIHSSLPLSKLRLMPPKGKNKHQNDYIFKFFTKMCDEMKLFKTLIEISHEYYLFGNCGAKWAEISELGGTKKIENIRVGDMVLTDKGRYKKVIKTCSRIAEKILRIKCWGDFREIPVTEEHPIEVYREGKFKFVPAGKITMNDFIRVTWPKEIEDTENIKLSFPIKYDVLEKGVNLNFIVTHPHGQNAVDARKRILNWLGSLSEPIIISRKELANKLDIEIKTFHNIIFRLGNEIGRPFHKRIGAKGWQKGSQVIWYPVDTSDIEVSDSYTIYKSRKLDAIKQLEINNDFCYIAGYWLGDGTLGRDSSRDTWGRGLWQINFKDDCYNQIQRVEKILINIFGHSAITKWDSEGMTYLKVISNPAFIEWWAENFGETSFIRNKKRIPTWVINLPEDKLKNFLSGILDSDGCIGNNGVLNNTEREGNSVNISIGMISRNIMYSIRDIILKCGGNLSFNKTESRVNKNLPRIKNKDCKPYYIINSSDYATIEIFTKYSEKKISLLAKRSMIESTPYSIRTDSGLAFKIKSITTEDYNDLVYNFEVEEDHTYQVAGFSTHNCFIFAEEDDWKENLDSGNIGQKKEEALQRAQLLKEKFDITDKNPLYEGWKKLLVLPPDQVRVRKLPLTDDVAIEYMPDPETRKFLTSDVPLDPFDPTKKMDYSISRELREKVRQSGVIPLDTDPYTGSHVYHLARKKSQYEPLGVSILERCINTLVLMDKLRQAQTSIASRHMTPMRVVWAEDLNPDDIDNLREQVDLALVDPDFSIIANYEIHWEEMGSNGRLLDVEAEMESSLNRLFAGLGVTREMLTGEGTYTGSRVSLEIMNTMYLLFREVLQEYIENYLFKPVAKKKGFIEHDKYGNEVLLYPRVSFTRLAIRDNEQFFDAAFQLYQKGSISIDLILDILNIDPDATKEKIEQDLFTVNDSLFNEMMRNLYTNVAAPLVEQTNVTDKLAEYLKLEKTAPAAPSAEGESRFSSSIDPEHRKKVAKLLKHFMDNPDEVKKIFAKNNGQLIPKQASNKRCAVLSRK